LNGKAVSAEVEDRMLLVVMRVPAIEAALKANWSPSALDSVKIPADGLMSDIHGTSDYRANLIKVMAQRAVAAAG
jgi:aerobic carbon-monoxide dehydrogenase medium subunit